MVRPGQEEGVWASGLKSRQNGYGTWPTRASVLAARTEPGCQEDTAFVRSFGTRPHCSCSGRTN